MTRRAFEHVLSRIAGNPVFANGTSRQQTPVCEQLHVALHQLGCNGNGVSIGKVARLFGVSEGTVINYRSCHGGTPRTQNTAYLLVQG